MPGTYKDIQEYVKKNYGISIKTCWIADVKRAHGLTKRTSPNRIDSNSVAYPCPSEHRKKIENALMYFKYI